MTHFPNMLKRELDADGIDLSKATSDQVKEGKKTIRNKFLAALMLSGSKGGKIQRPQAKHERELCDGNEQVP